MTCVPPASNAALRAMCDPVRGVRGAECGERCGSWAGRGDGDKMC